MFKMLCIIFIIIVGNWWRVRNYAKMALIWRIVIVIGQFKGNENRKQIPRSPILEMSEVEVRL